jgi:hypothetical protein
MNLEREYWLIFKTEVILIRDVNGAEIEQMILSHSLIRHLKYSFSRFSFPTLGRILFPSTDLHSFCGDPSTFK